MYEQLARPGYTPTASSTTRFTELAAHYEPALSIIHPHGARTLILNGEDVLAAFCKQTASRRPSKRWERMCPRQDTEAECDVTNHPQTSLLRAMESGRAVNGAAGGLQLRFD
ncbi:uncharacterized protein MYCGRDRAFT_106690 [Zymoseptoria tritici IPO323]|uniref:Uncharacterized protein n=1 Tax=Zymoseptoria tritici (strain CBS 115943 / IPO323) TaxID=336722 RepID=F9XRY8_ZYMTI|nr:uncharacterized protein MYCGRDRAFT_106690 [Zymoseptoria tritici IPO323]EGP82018.1 hypothetical protein MYCGRDRAFT_106690 [Zymoseptoria tritici IPO323]